MVFSMRRQPHCQEIRGKSSAAAPARRSPFSASLFLAAAIAVGGVGPLLEPALAPAVAEARFGRGGSFGFRGSRGFGRSRSFGRSAYRRGYGGGGFGFGLPFMMGMGFGGFGGSFLIPIILFIVLRMMIGRRRS